MNDVPASDYEGIDARALDDSGNEVSCDYRAGEFDTGSPSLSPLQRATSPVVMLCDSEAYGAAFSAKSMHNFGARQTVFSTLRYGAQEVF